MNISIPATETASTTHLAAASFVPATDRAGEPAALKFLLVYEDSQTGLRARQLMSQLVKGRDGGMNSKPVLFRFDLLRMREIWELAAQESQTVDVLVLSAHAAGSVPTEVKSWVTYWLGLKGGHPYKVIVSFDAASQQTSDDELTVGFFGSLTAWADVELVILYGEGPLAELNPALTGFSLRANKDLATVTQLMPRPRHPHNTTRRHWGLNE